MGTAGTDAERTVLNHYECPECGEHWTDTWSCACDDRCPTCRTSCSPTRSDDLGPDPDTAKD